MPLYAGFDCSTQSLTVIVIEVEGAERRVVFERSLDFDRELPQYATTRGAIRDPQDPLRVVSPPLLWADALDRLVATLAREVDVSRIRAISGSAQQHGSVYLNRSAGATLDALDPARPLADQLGGIFSRPMSPIWMDSSTASQCAAIEREMGGAAALARLTGSRAFERFTGPQIRKFYEADRDAYTRTDRIHLVSSYLASLLAGHHAPVDAGDASGMNLMNLVTRQWDAAALRATASDLDRKLPDVRESSAVVGFLSAYWTKKYGLPSAKVVIWSGDNPCSLIGTGLVREGRVAISLGTSDTIFGFMSAPLVSDEGTGHVFAAPTGDYMGITVFKNGSLARERVRDTYGLDWPAFSRALAATPPGNLGAIMLPWFDAEITPPVAQPAVRRCYGLDPADAAANVRAVVEAQMTSMKIHSRWMGTRVDTIYATGGASANQEILRVMADVFDADVYRHEAGNSACLGAALRAYQADRPAISWDEIVAGFTDPLPGSRIRPIAAHVKTYAELAGVYAACEAQALGARG